MKLKALLIIGLLVLGCAKKHVIREYREFKMNKQSISIGMSSSDVKFLLGRPIDIKPIGTAGTPQLLWRYTIDGSPNDKRRTDLLFEIAQDTVTAIKTRSPAD